MAIMEQPLMHRMPPQMIELEKPITLLMFVEVRPVAIIQDVRGDIQADLLITTGRLKIILIREIIELLRCIEVVTETVNLHRVVKLPLVPLVLITVGQCLELARLHLRTGQ